MLSVFLGVLWLWNAVAYHACLFARINPAAWIFSALFAVQAVLCLRAGHQKRPAYLSASGARQALGLVLAAYSLAYPFLTMALGHDYPATPTFGLPCPTTILTIGVLLTVPGRVPVSLSVVPILWGGIGGSAAVLLEVRADCVVLAAGVLLLVALVLRSSIGAVSDVPKGAAPRWCPILSPVCDWVRRAKPCGALDGCGDRCLSCPGVPVPCRWATARSRPGRGCR
jgi:hypothetical protein